MPSLATLKRLVYKRDAGICWGCGEFFPPDGFQLGHIIDRMVGGPDTEENVAVMCYICNRLKPVHATREEAEAWRAAGGGTPDLMRALSKIGQ